MAPVLPFLDIVAASKRFGVATVLDGVGIGVARGEFVSLLGPSGCGKTTLLRIIAGLLTPDDGTVRLDGEDITRKPPHRRDIGVVFQNYALFPHLTVSENIAFGLQSRRVDRDEIRKAVAGLLDLVHLTEFADRSVRLLSGGQQQRVAVARALAVKPKLLLFDEPFSALDRKLREVMQIELKRLLREVAATAIFVTHDQDEALTMSDRVAVMNRGAIDQFAEPAAVYHRPATSFALGFVGLSTRLAGTVRDAPSNGEVLVETSIGSVRGAGGFVTGTPVIVGVRPERIRIGTGSGNSAKATLTDVVFQGSKTFLHFAASSGDQFLVETSDPPRIGLEPGSVLDLTWSVEDTLLYPTESTR